MDVGLRFPSWAALAQGERPSGGSLEDGPGLPRHGRFLLPLQFSIDSILVLLRRDGVPHPRCVNEDEAVLAAARRRKELRCPKLAGDHGPRAVGGPRQRSGGRWSENRDFLGQLAKAKTRSVFFFTHDDVDMTAKLKHNNRAHKTATSRSKPEPREAALV